MTDAQDPRFLRSRERLRASVLEVAAERPVDGGLTSWTAQPSLG